MKQDNFWYPQLNRTGFDIGKGSFTIDFLLPKSSQISSAKCGAKGDNKTVKGRKISILLQSKRDNSFTQIIKELTHVLNEKFSISLVIFFMVS